MRRRLSLLRECAEVALFTDQSVDTAKAFQVALSNRAQKEDVVAMETWAMEFVTSCTVNTLHTQLSVLQDAVDTLPVLTLYVPVLLPEVELATMAKWCREEVVQNVLFAIHVDAKVVGGCAFVWNDAYHDFSFTARSKKHPDLITQKLHSYV
jgi:hypothetical protein